MPIEKYENEDKYNIYDYGYGVRYTSNKYKPSYNCCFFQDILESIWNIFCPPKKIYRLCYDKR